MLHTQGCFPLYGLSMSGPWIGSPGMLYLALAWVDIGMNGPSGLVGYVKVCTQLLRDIGLTPIWFQIFLSQNIVQMLRERIIYHKHFKMYIAVSDLLRVFITSILSFMCFIPVDDMKWPRQCISLLKNEFSGSLSLRWTSLIFWKATCKWLGCSSSELEETVMPSRQCNTYSMVETVNILICKNSWCFPQAKKNSYISYLPQASTKLTWVLILHLVQYGKNHSFY